MAENFYKVKLRSQVSRQVVSFDVVPDVNETRSVEYKSMNPIHMPGTIYAYGHTSSRLFGINNARFISRTPEEAAFNLARLNILRSWTMPYFGNSNEELIGSPPDVLSFYAFSVGPSSEPLSDNSSQNTTNPTQSSDGITRRSRPTHIHNIPVVIYNLQVTYPSDLDYIPTAAATFKIGNESIEIEAGVPMPTIMATDIQLYETHSPSEFNNFSLEQYRKGRLDFF